MELTRLVLMWVMSLLRPGRSDIAKLRNDGSVVDGSGTSVVVFRRPWGYPDRNNERDPTVAGNDLEPAAHQRWPPYPQKARPPVQLGTDGPVGNQLRLLNQQAACPGDTDLYNLRYIGHAPFTPGYGSDGEGGDGGDASGTTPLGDPVVFSAYLIGQIANNPRFAANFNREADRGYGHLCWDWTRNRDDQAGLHDPRGHPYPAPLVLPPEGAPTTRAGTPTRTGGIPHRRHRPGRRHHRSTPLQCNCATPAASASSSRGLGRVQDERARSTGPGSAGSWTASRTRSKPPPRGQPPRSTGSSTPSSAPSPATAATSTSTITTTPTGTARTP